MMTYLRYKTTCWYCQHFHILIITIVSRTFLRLSSPVVNKNWLYLLNAWLDDVYLWKQMSPHLFYNYFVFNKNWKRIHNPHTDTHARLNYRLNCFYGFIPQTICETCWQCLLRQTTLYELHLTECASPRKVAAVATKRPSCASQRDSG